MPEQNRREAEGESQALLTAIFRMICLTRTHGSREVIDLAAMFVLKCVAENPGIRVSEAASLVGLDASTLSRLTRNLEQAGYLHRHPDPRDGRAAQMCISELGEAELARALVYRTTMIDETLERWPAAQRARFVELSERFIADFEKS